MTFISLIPSIYVNVKQYGAKGDGITDDTTAIQNAINAAATGSVIFFPAGTYLVSSTIQLVAELAYLGTTGSYGSSTIKQKNSSNLPAVLAASGWYNNNTFSDNPVRIENLLIDGNNSNNTTSHGIVLMNYDSIIRECTVINAPGCGIVISSINRSGGTLSNTAVENRIESCKISGAGTHGIWIHDSGNNATDGYLDSCIVSGTTQDGIHMDTAVGWFIQHNHTYATAMNAYELLNCYSTYVIGNEVDGYGNSGTANYYSGIGMTLIGPRASIIEGNTINVNQETNDSSTYQHLNVTGGGSTDTHAIVIGNHILGGYVSTTSTTSITSGTTTACTPNSMDSIFVGQHLTVGSENITVGAITNTTFSPSSNWANNHGPSSYSIVSNKSTSNSLGIVYQANSTQTSSGQKCTITSISNRVDNCGLYNFFDGNAVVGPVGIDGGIALTQSLSYAIQSISNSSTITTIGNGSIIVTATANVNAVILQAGTQAGQTILVNNESAFTIQFAASGTSNVAAGVAEIIQANSQRIYVWDAVASLWYGPASVGQQSATAATTASSGTITTAGVDQARVAPTGNITGVILQAGTYANQGCVVVNESAFTVTFAASGTSHVADGTSAVIAATRCMIFRWDSGTSLWYHA